MIHNLQKQNKHFIFHDCLWKTFMDTATFDTENHHIFISPGSYINHYDFFNYLGLNIAKNYYVAYDFNTLLNVNYVNPYNIFGKNNPNNEVDSLGNKVYFDYDAIVWIIENGVTTINHMIRAGIYDKERFVQHPVPPWILNVENYFTKGVILEYELFPEKKVVITSRLCIGKLTQEKFLESANYRYIIYDFMARVLCQYGINFGKITEFPPNFKINFNFLLD